MKADLERKLTDLEDSVARERQRANDSDIGRLAFPSFLRSIETRRENLRATLKEIERERAVAQDDLAAAFQDLKAFELATEQQTRRWKKRRPGAPEPARRNGAGPPFAQTRAPPSVVSLYTCPASHLALTL